MSKKNISSVQQTLAHNNGVYYFEESLLKHEKLSRYTGIIDWCDDEGEEIDVDAIDRTEAKQVVIAALKEGYEPGWKKIEIIGVRVGLYI